ncbi:hypothetical protein PR048_027273 [Dryococelus australis]|uniref:Uncharacterized protein n=1 Tax=Dryococelus australis TaxID=614101 RepID=A0ABQ9GG91_9NEOP|nr:hypothetical protein PR048_027273 [Dryococelus australis]
MFCLLDVVFVSVLLFHADRFVSSEENVTSREGHLTTQGVSRPVEGSGNVTSPSPKAGNMSHVAEHPQLAMEGGGTVLPVTRTSGAAPVVVSPRTTGGDRGVVSSAAPTAPPGAARVSPVLVSSSTSAPSDVPGKALTLNDEVVKHTDIDKLLETSESGSHTKTSSIVARKGAPPDAPGVAGGDDSREMQSLFGDETKSGSASATIVCSNATLQGNDSTNNNCSQNEHLEKSSSVTYDTIPSTSPTTVAAAGIGGNNSETAPRKQTENVKISKPAVLHGHVVSASHNNSISKSDAPHNIHNSIVKKVLKPATTTGIDESKEQFFPTDTPASKGDYIIPIIGIILAVPMVVILFMFFYKRSAEFWERRHYKRMDFLIDGMYND